jgi:hypothetical protein
VLLAAAVAIFILEITDTTHWFHKTASVRGPGKPITRSTAQPSSGEKNPATRGSSRTEGTADDKSGQKPSGVSDDPTLWSKSESGKITIKLPVNNGELKNGGTVYGSSSLSQVQYRLIDDEAGVIAQGPINVVDGNFTATLNFKAYAKSGRLDIFSTEPGGREINEVQIAVRF